jgi:putative ABC transport system permease protein
MKMGFYPKMAADGIKKNGRLYVPYLITCILMVAIYYIIHFLGYSNVMEGMAGATSAREMMQIGSKIITIFAAIFLFYTQSTLIKGRKKEFGLYSILGMNKSNIGRILFFETVIIWVLSISLGLVAGIGLSKLAELGFTRLISVPTSYKFTISFVSVRNAVIIFSVVFFLIYLNSVRQIRFASATQLVAADKAGEKPPKANWVVGILGLLILGAGYVLALKIEQPMSALLWFFVAVILVIVGTYLVLIAGSVLLCRILQKNKNYYYKTNHFVSVSSMAYRMKRNGAGLASICILLTMVLVMISSTSALFAGKEECLYARYPNDVGAFACTEGYDPSYKELGRKLEDKLISEAEKNGATVTDNITYSEYEIAGYLENSKLTVKFNSMSNLAFVDYDKVAMILFMDVEDYNRVFGHNEVVAPGEAKLGTTSDLDIGEVFSVEDVSFKITGRFDDKVTEIDPAANIAVSPTVYLLVNNLEEVAQKFVDYKDYNDTPMMMWYWYSRFNTGLEPEGQIALASTLDNALNEELADMNFTNFYCESHEAERDDFVSTFGGLFFLGILLSIIFLVSCVIIIYYKQISEGFEDQARFGIMKKVGMTTEDIRSSVNSQMLTVFMIPIVLACLHLIVVLPIVNKLLMLFGLFHVELLILTSVICMVVFGIFYAIVYKITSNAYVRIVSA